MDQARIRKGNEKRIQMKRTPSLGRLGGSGAATKGRQGNEKLRRWHAKVGGKRERKMMIFQSVQDQYLYNPVNSNLRVTVRSHESKCK